MKKVTLFVDKTVRSALAKNRDCSISYRAALDFFGQVVAYGSDPHHVGSTTESCQDGFKKFVCGCHHESGVVKKVFSEAYRLEACLTYRGFKAITLQLQAYRSGERKAYHTFKFTFDKDGSPAGACY